MNTDCPLCHCPDADEIQSGVQGDMFTICYECDLCLTQFVNSFSLVFKGKSVIEDEN